MSKTTRRTFVAGAGAIGAGVYVNRLGIRRARANEPVRIGGQGAMSGAHADYGLQMRMGAELAIAELNEAGGILGREIVLNWLDEELRPDVATRNCRQLVEEWGADMLVGIDSSGSAMAVGQIMPELDRILIVSHGATHRFTEELVARDGIKQIFRASVPIYQDAILAAYVFAEREDIVRWANIGADYEYGHASWLMFKDTLSKLRPDVEFVAEAWAPFQTLDFSGHVSSVMAQRPDAVFATPWAGEAISMLRAALSMGGFAQIQAWWQAMGGSVDVLEGVSGQLDQFDEKLWATARYVFTYSPDETKDLNDAFLASFQEKFNRLPNYSAECTYSAIKSYAQAAQDAGSTDTADVIEALEGMEIATPAGMRTYRPEDHQAVYAVPGGRIVRSDDWPIPVIGADLALYSPEDYYRWPPFEPID